MSRPSGPLTGGSLSVVPGVYVPFALAAFGPGHLLHAVDLGDAQLGVEGEVHLPGLDGEVPVVPVPQLLQVLVVEDVEGVVPGSRDTASAPRPPSGPRPAPAAGRPPASSAPRGSRTPLAFARERASPSATAY